MIVPHSPSQEESISYLLSQPLLPLSLLDYRTVFSGDSSVWFSHTVNLYVLRSRDPLACLRVQNTGLVGIGCVPTQC